MIAPRVIATALVRLMDEALDRDNGDAVLALLTSFGALAQLWVRGSEPLRANADPDALIDAGLQLMVGNAAELILDGEHDRAEAAIAFAFRLREVTMIGTSV